jgi:hypothetical protein
MAAQRTSFEKLQRDRAKKAKAAIKRERRQDRSDGASDEPTSPEIVLADDGKELTATELLALVEELHRQFKDEEIEFEEFEERKVELMARLPVD